MITVIIGHRGVGKTSYLKSISKLDNQIITYDLDCEIENKLKIKISDLFYKKGEKYFRTVEQRVFKQLINSLKNSKKHIVISLGAGFIGKLPTNINVVWLRRETDKTGRIFLNRPRLNSSVSSIEEYIERFNEREKRYLKLSNHIIYLREGKVNRIDKGDLAFWTHKSTQLDSMITLTDKHLENNFVKKQNLEYWNTFKNLNLEIRTDLLSRKNIYWILDNYPTENLLFSLRNSITLDLINQFKTVDVALELDPLIVKKIINNDRFDKIISSHRIKKNQIQNRLKYLEQFKKTAHLKIAPNINNWNDFLIFHKWWMKDTQSRSFLPRSPDGRWKWYRLFYGKKMKLSFINNGFNEVLDQPNLNQWLSINKNSTHFAAIIGYPISHSFTPVEQESFFKKMNMPVLPISISPEMNFTNTVNILKKLGLKAAAITSPYKNSAFKKSNLLTSNAKNLKSVNTIFIKKNEFIGENTDLVGLQKLTKPFLKHKKIAIWGGGGTFDTLKNVIPHGIFFKNRTGQIQYPLKTKVQRDWSPTVFIWAAGSYELNSILKCKNWKPRVIIDLNYSENSPARDYALLNGAKYVSGLKMFLEQAKYQREFWDKCFKAEEHI